MSGGAEVLVEPGEMLVDGRRARALGNVVVRWKGPEEAGFGDVVEATGRLRLPIDQPGFDRRAYLGQRQAYLELDATDFRVRAPAEGLQSLPRWLRTHYVAALDDALPPPHAAVLLGVVLGIRHGIPARLQQALIDTGLIHLLVLSGLKVAVFARIVQATLRPLLGRWAAWPALGLVGVYALVGGATPAAVRAAVMGGLVIAAGSLGRPTHVWTSLAIAAAAMLGWHPDLARDVGFQLSFAGTAAIVLLTPTIERWVGWIPGPVREPFAVTCAAQVGTLPMMAADFHVLSVVGPVANALVLPMLPAMITMGIALGPLDLVPPLARAVALPLAGLLAYLEQAATVLARVPLAALPIVNFPPWAGLAYYSGVGPLIVAAHSAGRRRVAAVAVGILAPLVIAAGALATWSAGPADVTVVSVGDGQSVLFRGPHGAVLVDGGPSPERIRDELGQLLPPWQSRLAGVVITAPSLGHVGGLAGVGRAAGVLVVPATELSGAARRAAAFEAIARGARLVRAEAGGSLRIADFNLEILSPEPTAKGDEVGTGYLALRVVWPGGRSFCDLSDLDVDSQTVAAARLRGPCSYLLLPSGGRSLLSPDLERLAGAASQWVASRGQGRLAAGLPPTVLRTDQEGSITLPL